MKQKDKDPAAWYRAFEALLNRLKGNGIAETQTTIQAGPGQSLTNVAAGEDYAQDSEEIWEDAPEHPTT